MNKIQTLIAQHCPNGVDWRTLEQCCNILDNQRKPVTKNVREKGEYPYYGANGIQDYVSDYIFDGTFLLVGEDGSVITKSGNPVVTWAKGKIWVNNHAHIMAEIEGVLLRYLFYFMQTISIRHLVRGNIPKFTGKDFRSIPIPIPPIPVQEEIVRILDAFTNLQTNLQTELELRKKQYKYYRDKLLVQDYPNGVEHRKLGEISTIKTGKSNAQDAVVNGIYPLFDRSQTIKRSNRFLFDDEAIIVAGEGNFTPKYFNGKFDLHQRAYAIYKIKQAIPKFVFYAILSNQKYFKRVAVDSTVISLRVKHLEDFPIPIPPLEEQKRIVGILDKFDKLVSDISIGIPAEIEMRKKQYEYYRDSLLRFEGV